MSSFLMQDFVCKDEAGFNDIAEQNSDGKKDFLKSHYNASTILVFPRSMEMSHIIFFFPLLKSVDMAAEVIFE